MAPETTTFPLAEPIRLQVRLHGTVEVFARDGLTEATVRLTPRVAGGEALARTMVEMSGSTLIVAGPRNSGLTGWLAARVRDRDAVDARIEVPTDTPVKIATLSTDITLVGRCGDADLVTGSADIGVESVAGNVRLRIGSGQSRIGPVSGSVRAHAGSGDMRLDGIGGMVDCSFGSGSLQVASVGGALRWRAGSGDVHIDAAHGDVDVATGSGSITLGLPAGVSARLDITTGSGELHSDLPVEATQAAGSRSITVRGRTGSGDVRLVRAAPSFSKNAAEKPSA